MKSVVASLYILIIAVFLGTGTARAEGLSGTWKGHISIKQTGPEGNGSATCDLMLTLEVSSKDINVSLYRDDLADDEDDIGGCAFLTEFGGSIDSDGHFTAQVTGSGPVIAGKVHDSSIEWHTEFTPTDWNVSATVTNGVLQYDDTLANDNGRVRTSTAQLRR